MAPTCHSDIIRYYLPPVRDSKGEEASIGPSVLALPPEMVTLLVEWFFAKPSRTDSNEKPSACVHFLLCFPQLYLHLRECTGFDRSNRHCNLKLPDRALRLILGFCNSRASPCAIKSLRQLDTVFSTAANRSLPIGALSPPLQSAYSPLAPRNLFPTLRDFTSQSSTEEGVSVQDHYDCLVGLTQGQGDEQVQRYESWWEGLYQTQEEDFLHAHEHPDGDPDQHCYNI